MRVRSLRLQNIKGYRGEHVFGAFAKGVVLILGRNGCGKTTLAECIGLAVFGTIPAAFRGKSGRSLEGFISHGERAGTIEAVVEIRPGRILTFQVDLVAPTPEKLSPKNEVRIRVFDGDAREDDLVTQGPNLSDSETKKSISDFVRAELHLRVEPDELFTSLLAPPQSGGLTDYLKETPQRRRDQTERILGLKPVRDVAREIQRLKATQRHLATERGEVLSRSMEDAAGTWSAFGHLRQEHRNTSPPFEGLRPFDVAQAAAASRQELLPDLVEASRQWVVSIRRAAQAEETRKQISGLLRGVRDVHTKLIVRRQKLKEFERIRVLSKRASEFKEEGETYERAERDERTLNEAAKKTQADLAEAGKEKARLETRDEGLQAEIVEKNAFLKRLTLKLETDTKTESAFVEQLKAHDERGEAAKTAVQAAQLRLERVRMLREVMETVHGMDDARFHAKLDSLREACEGALLPEEARPIVMELNRRMEGEVLGAPQEHVAALDLIHGWERTATEALGTSESLLEALEKDAREVDGKKRLFELESSLRSEQIEGTKEALLELGESKKTVAADLKTRTDEGAALSTALQQANREMAALNVTLLDEERRERWLAWKHATREARCLDEVEAALERANEAVRELALELDCLERFGLSRPELGDLPAWEALSQDCEALSESAQETVAERLKQEAQARTAHGAFYREIEAVDGVEAELHDKLSRLHEARASEAELATLADDVLGRLPRLVASRVIARVSTLADEFFQRLFVLPGDDLQMVWEPESYAVILRRGEERQPARHASGGEQMAMGIALNLAVLHFMAPQVRWLLLDEPTASLDAINRAALRDFMAQLDDGQGGGDLRLFDQLFFISHESRLFEGMGQSLLLGE